MRTEPGRRLLAISWEMPPLSGPRAVQVTRTLVELGQRGWQSRVICFGPRSDRYQQDFQVDVERESGGAVRLERVASPEEWLFFRALWRLCPPVKRLPDEKRVWVKPAVAAARRLLADEPADLIASFAQPWSNHLVGLRLHRETGLPWVAHFSDPWVDNPYEHGPAWQLRRRVAMERAVIGSATRVVFVNHHAADCVMAKYPQAWRARVRVVPQGFEQRGLGVGKPKAGADGPVERRAEGPLRIVYTGRFDQGRRTPLTLLDALAALDRERPLEGRVQVEFIGADMENYAREATARRMDSLVRFTGRRSPLGAQDAAAGADVLLVIDAPSEGPSLFLPSKLIDYLPLGRPILGITPINGPTADLVRALGYPVADPADVRAVAAAIQRLLEAHEAGVLGKSSTHDTVARAYDIRETTTAFAAVLREAREGA